MFRFCQFCSCSASTLLYSRRTLTLVLFSIFAMSNSTEIFSIAFFLQALYEFDCGVHMTWLSICDPSIIKFTDYINTYNVYIYMYQDTKTFIVPCDHSINFSTCKTPNWTIIYNWTKKEVYIPYMCIKLYMKNWLQRALYPKN